MTSFTPESANCCVSESTSSSTRDTSLIYVAGYGRSGSTLLDSLLGNHPDMFGGGELRSLFRRFPGDDNCSCGKPLRKCSFWQAVIEEVFRACPGMDCSKAAALTTQTESVTGSRREMGRYLQLWETTFRTITAISGKPVIVDSSKSDRLTHHRLPLLVKRSGIPVKTIHLVRDARAVMWSTLRGNNRLLEKGYNSKQAKNAGGVARGLLSWMFANRSVDRWHQRHPSMELQRIRYEDLVRHPDDTFASLGNFLGIDLREVIEKVHRGDSFDPGHGVAGNRMRRSGPIVMKFDQEWRQKLPCAARVLSLISWPLMRQYGYTFGRS